MEVSEEIGEAIRAAIKAGVFWRAARLNPKTRTVWEALAAPHHQEAANLLQTVADRGAQGARPHSRQDG